MGVLTDIAKRTIGLTKAQRTTDARLGWVENELRNLRLGFKVADDKMNRIRGTPDENTLKPPKAANALPFALLLDVVNCPTNGAIDGGTYVNTVILNAGDAIAVEAFGGLPVADDAGTTPPGMVGDPANQANPDGTPRSGQATVAAHLAVPGNTLDGFNEAAQANLPWNPTFDGVVLKVTHRLVTPGKDSLIGGAPCDSPCEAMVPEEIVAEGECSAITVAGGPVTIDCAGHVHEMYEYTLTFTAVSTAVDCLTGPVFQAVQDLSVSCTPTGTSDKTFSIQIDYDVFEQSVYSGSVSCISNIWCTTDYYGNLTVNYNMSTMNYVCGLLVSVADSGDFSC